MPTSLKVNLPRIRRLKAKRVLKLFRGRRTRRMGASLLLTKRTVSPFAMVRRWASKASMPESAQLSLPRWRDRGQGQQQTADQGKNRRRTRDANRREPHGKFQRRLPILGNEHPLQGHGVQGEGGLLTGQPCRSQRASSKLRSQLTSPKRSGGLIGSCTEVALADAESDSQAFTSDRQHPLIRARRQPAR